MYNAALGYCAFEFGTIGASSWRTSLASEENDDTWPALGVEGLGKMLLYPSMELEGFSVLGYIVLRAQIAVATRSYNDCKIGAPLVTRRAFMHPIAYD